MFGEAGKEDDKIRWLARAAPVVAVLYNVAFLSTTGMICPILGAVILVVILLFTVWGVARARVTSLSVVHLGTCH